MVYVCTIHQNTKLMMIADKLVELTANKEVQGRSQDYLKGGSKFSS